LVSHQPSHTEPKIRGAQRGRSAAKRPPTNMAWTPPKSLDELVAFIRDPKVAQQLESSDFQPFLTHALIAYGHVVDGELIPYLRSMYQRAIEELPVETRLRMFQEVNRLVIDRVTTYNAILPFLHMEPDSAIASSAALEQLTCAERPDASDMMERMARILAGGGYCNPGAVFAGMVLFGDERTHLYLERTKGLLPGDAVQVAARLNSGFLTDAQVQFWLDWAEELVDQRDPESESIFGSVASALALCRRGCRIGKVVRIRRPTPFWKHERAVEGLQEWPLDAYARRIAPRLYALEAAESPPRIFSVVLTEWGLEPRAPLSEQAGRPL
jgi:hypothetical protein